MARSEFKPDETLIKDINDYLKKHGMLQIPWEVTGAAIEFLAKHFQLIVDGDKWCCGEQTTT